MIFLTNKKDDEVLIGYRLNDSAFKLRMVPYGFLIFNVLLINLLWVVFKKSNRLSALRYANRA